MNGVTLSQSAYLRLKDDIIQGRIAAESVLSERGLAEDLGISRTPLRIALSQLENEGAIDRLNNGVILVRSVTAEQLFEIVKLRQQLESAAAARAAGYPMTPELSRHRDEMQRVADGAETEFDAFWGADEQVHIAIARMAQLVILPGILAEQRAVARRCTLTRTYVSFTEQAREHLAIIDAVAGGDPDAAHAAMWLHFDHVRERFLQTFTGAK